MSLDLHLFDLRIAEFSFNLEISVFVLFGGCRKDDSVMASGLWSVDRGFENSLLEWREV